ncbi:glycosyltransferase [Herbiconiux sp.]|uniref:glycosyltransferase n=1 Tax=Herbiconiux sp. TaxID=1871186 RepID=UPI0025C3F69F|nr:glycosyltransferase [Herbiconiux sp.]
MHYLFTRFNVALSSEALPTSDAWLSSRLALFERFAVDSVIRQTVKDFKWVVAFDDRSPAWFRTEIENRTGNLFEPVWISGKFDATKLIQSLRLPQNEAYSFLSTRMDNDDAVAEDFVEAIQHAAKSSNAEFLNLTNGLQYSAGRVYSRLDPSNPFISRQEQVEVGSSPRTVFERQHDQLRELGSIQQVRLSPLWMQIVHDENLANSIKGVRADPRKVTGFSPSIELVPIGRLRLTAERARTAVRMGLRVVSRPSRIRWLIRSLTGSR